MHFAAASGNMGLTRYLLSEECSVFAETKVLLPISLE
jgi:hypothetical protein